VDVTDQPVRAPGASLRARRFRWAVAIGILVIVSLVTVVGAYVLSGAAGAAKSLTAAYAPKDTVAFVDVRADLPGDQHEKLADFLSPYPGFRDRAQFDSAFNDILNRITGAISPDLTYTWALRGWTTGEVSIAVTSFGLPNLGGVDPGSGLDGIMGAIESGLAAGASSDPALSQTITVGSESGVLIVGLKDRGAGEEWVASEVGRTGIQFSAQDYAGTSLYVAQQSGAALATAYAFTDRVFVAGEVSAVKAALDAPTRGSLADSDSYKAAMKSFSGDCIGTFYLDPRALLTGYLGWLQGLPGISLPSAGGSSTSSIPAWVAGYARAESDRMSVEIKIPKAEGAASPGNRESVLASQLPGSTAAVLELRSVGSSIQTSLDALIPLLPASEAQLGQQLRDALNLIGGVDWVGDGAMVLTAGGAALGGGVVVKTPDSTTAAGKKALVTTIVSLAGASYGITETDETYNGTTITMVSIPAAVVGSPLQIGIAVKDDLLVAGYGDSFAKSVIDTQPGNSLASQADYQNVMGAVGRSNIEYGYWNVPAMVDQLGQDFLGVSPDYYNLNYKPYFDHLGGIAFAVIDGNTVTLLLVVTAR
jgi:hypothetical protein